MPTIFHGGGHMSSDIGSMADIGPPATKMKPGHVVGLIPALNAIGTVGGVAASAAIRHRQKVKEYNDAKGFAVVGAQGYHSVQSP